MVKCPRCKLNNGAHHPACPMIQSGDERNRAEKDYEAGYRKGALGGNKPAKSSPSYDLGYEEGKVTHDFPENAGDEFEDMVLEPGEFEELDDDPLRGMHASRIDD